MRNGPTRQPPPPNGPAPRVARRTSGGATLFAWFLRAPALLFAGIAAGVVIMMVGYLYYDTEETKVVASAKPVVTAPSTTVGSEVPTGTTDRPGAAGDPDGWTALDPAFRNYQVEINNDGSLRSGKQAIELYGVKMLPRSRICSYQSGERWACGQRAYIALLNVMGATTIDCRPKDPGQASIVICRLAGTDLAELMLREGWGTLAGGVTEKRYIDAAAAAFANKTGMWTLRPPPRR